MGKLALTERWRLGAGQGQRREYGQRQQWHQSAK